MFKEIVITLILELIVLSVAFINNLLIEMVLFICLFYFVKNKFSKQFHADILTSNSQLAVYLCFFITFIIQLVMMKLLVSYRLSFYLNVILAIMLGILSYVIEDYLEIKINKNPFENAEKLKIFCEVHHLSDLDFNRLKMRYIDNLKIKEIANIEKIEEQSIRQCFQRIKKKVKI